MLRLTFPFLAILILPAAARAADIDKDELANIDAAVAKSLKRNDCPGAVVLVVHADEVALRKAYGSRSVKPEKMPMTVDTVFDMASLTKPVATGTSIMILIERGKLKPEDLVSKYWPEFAANGKDKVTIATSSPAHVGTDCGQPGCRLRRRPRQGF